MLEYTDPMYHHGNLKQALIDAAAELASENGIKSFSLRQVAKRVGVSHPSVYNHFENKETLLAEVAKTGYAALDEAMGKSVEGLDGNKAKLARFGALGTAYVSFAVSNPHKFRVMFCEGTKVSADEVGLWEVAERPFHRVLASVKECQSADASVDPILLTLLAWSAMHGLATLWLDGNLAMKFGGDQGADELSVQVGALIGRLLD